MTYPTGGGGSSAPAYYPAARSSAPAPKKPAPKPAAKPTPAAVAASNSSSLGTAASAVTGHPQRTIDATPDGSFNSAGEPIDGLIGPLKLPQGLTATSAFVWDYNTQPDAGIERPGDRGGQTLTTMTVAGAMSWLKSLAVNDKDHYNLVVHQLVAAGYLTPEAARYNSYSIDVGNQFLRSIADVWSIDRDPKTGGATVRWVDHINDLIKGRQDAGQIDANGMPLTSGSANQGPVRQDNWSDPETVKASINNAAKNILGRELTDKEVSAFAGAFHAQEQAYNDKVWAGQQATAAGNTASMPDRPSVSAAAQNYEDSNPAQTQERTSQLLGSYMGVLRNMTGLGSGGISSAVR